MKLGIVVPCYNEEEVLHETTKRLSDLFSRLIDAGKIDSESFICYVDDGSKDKTWEMIEEITQTQSHFKGIKLSRNFGHQNALLAGLMQLKNSADALISMDADLQDDIELVWEFVAKYQEGYEIVYGVREDRSSDSRFKRGTAESFYKLQHIMGIETVHNHADYRLMSSRALEALSEFKEINLFLRGIIPMIGFRSTNVYYTRSERFAGESKYPFKKMLFFALDGIASFSVTPLRFITITGFVIFVLSLFMIGWILFDKFVLDSTVQGWASTMVSIYFIGGIQMISLGLIGEYMGRTFQQVKERPRYFIDKEI